MWKNNNFILFSRKCEMSLKWQTIYSNYDDNGDDNFISELKSKLNSTYSLSLSASWSKFYWDFLPLYRISIEEFKNIDGNAGKMDFKTEMCLQNPIFMKFSFYSSSHHWHISVIVMYIESLAWLYIVHIRCWKLSFMRCLRIG